MGTRFIGLYCAVIAVDHPHAYGDKRLFLHKFRRLEGSSPRVWGQEKSSKSKKDSQGIIPTRMGTSNLYGKIAQSTTDHPHAYGDKTKG